jgi:hypothetical protein
VLITFTLPRIHAMMAAATIEAIYARPGDALAVGAKLCDLTVDLSAVAAQDCPPISHFRIVLRERLWVREVGVAPATEVAVGATLVRFTTAPDEPLAGPAAREARVSIAGILAQTEAWERQRA